MLISWETGVAFAMASVLLDLAPGPDNLFVLSQSLRSGFRAGVVVTLGLCTGLLVHTLAVVLGVAALVQSSPLAFTLLKYLGAAYLLYLAWQLVKGAASDAAPAVSCEGRRLYRRGVLMSLSNPKLLLFFLAFLPQFTDPAQGRVAEQLLLLGGLFTLLALLVFCLISWLAGQFSDWFERRQASLVWFNRGTAVLFAGLALKLALG